MMKLVKSSENRPHLIWRIVVVMAAASLIWILQGWIVAGEEYSRERHFFSAAVIPLLVLPLVILARKYLDRRPWKGLKLTSLSAGWKPFVIGALCYLIPASAGLLLFSLLGWTEIRIQMSAGELLLAVLTLMLLVFFYEAFPEELLFRGYFHRNLNGFLPQWQAVAGQTILFVLFALAIGAATNWTRISIFLGIGIVVGIIRVVTGNVWSAVGFHVAFQTLQQFFSNRVGHDISTSSPELIEMIILGLIPFSFAILTLGLLVRKKTDWNKVNPE